MPRRRQSFDLDTAIVSVAAVLIIFFTGRNTMTRQQLRLRCLELAIGQSARATAEPSTKNDVIKRAETFLAFVIAQAHPQRARRSRSKARKH